MSSRKIAEKAEISWEDLDEFLTGEKTLPSDAIDRLVKIVKLKLPTAKPRSRKPGGRERVRKQLDDYGPVLLHVVPGI